MFGINLGTLNTSISNLEQNSIKTVLSETSNRTFPSLITLTNTERLYGDSAAFNIKSFCERSLFAPHKFLSDDVNEIIKEHQFSSINKLNNINNSDSNNLGNQLSDDLYIELQKGINLKEIANSDISSKSVSLNGEFSYISLLAIYFSKINSFLNKHVKAITNSNDYNLHNLLNSQLTVKNRSIIEEEKNKAYYTIAVPDYFTLKERNKLLDAVKISTITKSANNNKENQCSDNNINEKRLSSRNLFSSFENQSHKEVYLLNESSAITLFYGFNRRKELANLLKSEQRLVCFVDIGHAKTSIIFSSFNQTTFSVDSVTVERFLGARNMDLKLAEKILQDFFRKNKLLYDSLNNNTKINVKPKQYYRLLESIATARKTLTANEETTINLESFYQDYDLNYRLSRKDFEESITEEVLLFKNILELALLNYSTQTKSDVSTIIRNLHSVEMAGDALRIPILQKVVTDIFQKPLSKTLAPDELISKGASIFSIMNSKCYSLNYDFLLNHYTGYEIELKFNVRREKYLKNNESNCLINYKLLHKYESVPIRKVCKISNPLDEIEFSFYSGKDFIKKYALNLKDNSSIAKFKDFSNSYLEFHIYLDINGIIWFDKSTIYSKDDRNDLVQVLPVLIEDESTLGYLPIKNLKTREVEMEKNDIKIDLTKQKLNDIENNVYKFKLEAREKISLIEDINKNKISFSLETELLNSLDNDLSRKIYDDGINLVSHYDSVLKIEEDFDIKIKEIRDHLDNKVKLCKLIETVKELISKENHSIQIDINNIKSDICRIEEKYFDSTIENLKSNDISSIYSEVNYYIKLMENYEKEITSLL